MECEICKSDVPSEEIKKIKIKNKIKNICDGCVAAIKGFA
jgi:hypothetical protein